MKIRRSNLLDLVHEAIVGAPQPSREEVLIAERDERQRQWRSHVHSYVSVNAGLVVMNLVMAILSGTLVPWSLFPMLGWGIGLGMHTLNHRSWLVENGARIVAAEEKLGIAPPPVRMLAEPKKPAPEDPWPELLAACHDAVARAKTLMDEVHPAAKTTVEDLSEGLATIDRLADGAERIQDVLDGLSPSTESLERQIQSLDRKIGGTTDEGLRDAHLANRALLIARQAKIDALRADRERMLAKAQGFLLAVENLHLDAARLSGPEASDALSGPVHRLTEELQILRSVDAELKRIGRSSS